MAGKGQPSGLALDMEATFYQPQQDQSNGGTGQVPQHGPEAHPPPCSVPPPPDYYTDDLPPAYQVASALPTYEEAELTKEGKLDPNHIVTGLHNTAAEEVVSEDSSCEEYEVRRGRRAGGRTIPGFTLLTFPIDGGDGGETGSPSGDTADTTLLGNDFVFFTAFLTAFLFNWMGFLLIMCFCRTIAAWYGALSGFGLSLAKWTLIVKHSTDLATGSDNTWLWWLFTAFGMIVCMRAIFQYLHIKRSWASLSIAARERLFFY